MNEPIRIGRGDRRGVLGCIVGQENNNGEKSKRAGLGPFRWFFLLVVLLGIDMI